MGAYNNLTFMPIIIANIAIGIVQELRAKKTLDRLSILSAPKASVIREGAVQVISTEETVLDDVVIFKAGNQIYADAIVLDRPVQVNEALITGEADEITKNPGDMLLSGSFVVAGECRARLDRVGRDSFVSKLTMEAKKHGKKRRSEMMRSLTRLVQVIGILIIPMGGLLFWQQHFQLDRTIQDSVVSTVASVLGMIPEGLYLLTSVALAVSVMRLARKKTMVHEMSCIETLARVDVLCVDKTGTVTENKMTVKDVVLLCKDRFVEDDIRLIMSDYVGNMGAENETMAALKKYFNGTVQQTAVKKLPFTSAAKYGGVSYDEDETYLLGAPEFILKEDYPKYSPIVEKYSGLGCRVLLLALYDGDIAEPGINAPVMPLALILLTNKIRPQAPETFRYFAQQGVSIKVISGDNPVTVSQVAVEAGIENGEKYVDASTLDSDEKIRAAAGQYTVFGRVTPEQKRKLVRAIKAAGHTVAMTGDGVNDVLALKDADCSIAMASGSDVACQVSQIVLLNSDFSAMPSVVAEGRRVINNVERSAALFLVKNIFSFILTFILLFATFPYPVTVSQLSLVSVFTIGFPSFVLALEPNSSLVSGKFLRNVIKRALPAGLTDIVIILGVIMFARQFGIPEEELATMASLLMGVVGLIMLFDTCKPFSRLRIALMCLCVIGFFGGAIILAPLFDMTKMSVDAVYILVVFAALTYPVTIFFRRAVALAVERLSRFMSSRRKGRHTKGRRAAG